MIWWMLVIYVFDYVGPRLYTSCILGWLIIKFLNKISFTYQKKKIYWDIFLGEVLEFVHLYNSSNVFFAELD